MQDQRKGIFENAQSRPVADRDRLIESIYRIALEPQTFDSFMGEWDAYIHAKLDELASLESTEAGQAMTAADPEIKAHFAVAKQLLDQMGRPGGSPEPPNQSLSAQRSLQMMIDAHGRIVWSAGVAASRFGLKPDAKVSDLVLSDIQRDALSRKIAILSQGTTVALDPLLLQIKEASGDRWHHMVARIMPDETAEKVILVSPVTPLWPEAMPRLLRKSFGLSPTEIDICGQVADGKSPAEVARERGNSIATVRTQIKSIMSKTRSSSQAEVVRLLHSVMRVAENETTVRRQSWSNAERTLTLRMPDRDMPVELFGNPNGYPVIFFHGLMDGNSATEAMRKLLHQHDFNLICPVRPWFGHAEGRADQNRSEAPGLFAEDVKNMIQQMGLKNPILYGHMGGALYAFATAAALPEYLIKGMLVVSGSVPFVNPRKQISRMSRRQQLVAFTARFTPAIMPFVIRAAISQIQSGGERKFLNSLYENSPQDLALIADPETRDLILSGYRFTAQQGQTAFEIDSLIATKDWSDIVEQSTGPVRFLHGTQDPTVDIVSVKEFVARRANRFNLRELTDTGQLVRYKHPETVIEELSAIREAS